MPNVQSINFSKTGADADLQAQQIALQRQQMMADMLRKQSSEPLESQTVSGRIIPISGFQALSKILQGGLSAYATKKGDEKHQELGDAKAKRSADMLRSLFSPTGSAEPAPIQLSSTPQASTPGAPMSDVAPAQMNPDQQRAMAAYQIDPELGRSLMTNMFNQTNEQKNNAAEGIDPKLAGALRTAKMRADGMFSMQPGTTTLDLSNGTERFSPKLGEGIQPTAGGGAQAIPGYGPAAAGIAGQTAQAQAAANAGFQLKEITAPDGSTRMVTAQQAAQMAGGGQPPPSAPPQIMPPGAPQQAATGGMPPQGSPSQGFPAGTQLPPPPNNANRMDILTQERQQIMARPDTDPRKAGDLAAITREINGTPASGSGPLNAPQAPQPPAGMPGIPLQSEAQKAAQVGAVQNQVAIGNSLATGGAAELLKSRDTARSANDELMSIDESRKAIKAGAYQGFGADMKTDAVKMAGAFGIPIDASKAANTDYLRSSLGKGILDNAKKLGVNPTDADARRLDAIMGTIGKDPQAMDKILTFREGLAQRSIERHNNDVRSAKGNGAQMPFDLSVQPFAPAAAAAAPASGIRRYNPQTGRIE